ncbi:MAG: hypothetical protein KGN77_01245 [Xanthomonadaceae bacterium]|nr:hypothetical protein [Xanthomonadaceae bacterium]MDE1963997.1 hypothetical protein [Xanthomonadaceae bacterium]
MTIRSLSLMVVLAAVAGSAMAGEAIHAASHRPPADRVHAAFAVRDSVLLAPWSGAQATGMSASMPACTTCH